MNSFTFQFVGKNDIDTYVDGQLVKEHKINTMMYENFCSDRSATFQRIPYYKFLKEHIGPSEQTINDAFWNNKIAKRLSDEMNRALFPYQRDAIHRMIKSKRCLNATMMGGGKTLQALCAMAYFMPNSYSANLIICPSYLRANWLNEIKTWLPEWLNDTLLVKKPSDMEKLGDKKIVIISYDMMVTASKYGHLWNTVLCDEAHFLKEIKTKRYKALSGIIKKTPQAFLLTGTPSPNRPKELFTLCSLLYPKVFSNMRVFTDRYCDGHTDHFGHYDARGSSNIQELAYLMKKVMIRIRMDLSAEIEETRDKVILQTKSVPKSYRALEKEFNGWLAKISSDEKAKFQVQRLASAMFRETAVIKVEPVISYIRPIVQDDNTDKTILWCTTITMYKALVDMLEEEAVKYISINGETPMKDRMGMIEAFRRDKRTRFAVLTTGSCSTGLNITPITKAIFTELTWSPTDIAQAEARIHRIGGAPAVNYTYLLCEGTLDEKVFIKLQNKTALATTVIDNGEENTDFEFGYRSKKIKLV